MSTCLMQVIQKHVVPAELDVYLSDASYPETRRSCYLSDASYPETRRSC